MLTNDWHGPTPQGLAEVVEIAETHVKAAKLVRADIVDHSYGLIFRAPAEPPDRQRALDQMERALNTYRVTTADLTGIDLRFV